MIPVFEAEKRNQKMHIPQYVKLRMLKWLGTIKDGTRLEVIIRPAKKRVTNDQRGYYWGVVIPILSEYFGHDNKDDIHEDLKLYFNPIQSRINPDNIVGGSTTLMSANEFYGAENSYVKRIVRWAAQEYGIDIPDPDEVADL